MSNSRPVRPERSFWRDEKLSLRHREWGPQLPAVDIDFLMIEYIGNRPRALIEYKHEYARPILPGHPSFRALVYLADGRQLPAFCVRYGMTFGWFEVSPLNEAAAKLVKEPTVMSECEFVTLLYRLRGRQLPPSIRMILRTAVTP